MRVEAGIFVMCLVGTGCVAGPEKGESEVPVDLTESADVDPNGKFDPIDGDDTIDTIDAVTDPVDVRPKPKPQPAGWVMDCVSDFVSHNGNYYSATVIETAAGSEVEISLHRLAIAQATGFGGEEQQPASSEIVWSDVVESRLVDGFFGFETPDMFLVAQATERRGLFTGSIGGESEMHVHVPIGVTCWSAEFELPATYDPATGGCVDDSGQPSRNDVPFVFARHTGFGQCSTFEGQLNEEAFGYPSFIDLDLRGSDLNAAALNFAHFIDVDLRGADLSNFSFGYSTVRGQVDDNTKLPADMWCSGAVDGDAFNCTQ